MALIGLNLQESEADQIRAFFRSLPKSEQRRLLELFRWLIENRKIEEPHNWQDYTKDGLLDASRSQAASNGV